LVNSKKLIPKVDQVYPLAEAEKAFDRMRAGDQVGKLVLIP
jgi:NADPH:quinone reductase-like Zn-dependent oxidoreductase